MSGETIARDPATASDLLHTGYTQQETRTQWTDRPHLLRTIPWVRPRDPEGNWQKRHPGVGELPVGHYRTALINDFMRHSIPIQVKLDLAGARTLYDDPDLTELTIDGPNPMSWAMPNERLPAVPYTITGEWRDFNAWFADDLNCRAAEDATLGAAYKKAVWRKVLEEGVGGGVPTLKQEFKDVPATRLFHWRTVADIAAGELPSGLVVPPSVAVARRLMADEPPPPELVEDAPAALDPPSVPPPAVSPPYQRPPRGKRR